MKIFSKNEYSELKSIIVGRIEYANWPIGDDYFDLMISSSTYPKKLKKGKIDSKIKNTTKKDLDNFIKILQNRKVKVYRPKILNWEKKNKIFNKFCSGMHSYSARDLLLVVGNTVIECPTPYICRQNEILAFDDIKISAIKNGCKWIAAPIARMSINDYKIKNKKIVLTEDYPIFDAANVLKFNDKLLYLISCTGNYAGARWLQKVVGNEFEVITWDGVYSHAHIDSTIAILNKKTILLNASRVKNDFQIPKFLRDKKKIYINDDNVKERDFYRFPYASKWIGLNILSLNPETVFIDTIQDNLTSILRKEGFEVLNTPLTHSRTLGGGFHCITCDLERSNES